MAALDPFDWGEFDALDWTPYKLIYISYGSMDFLKRNEIQQGKVIETFQNRPFFLRNYIGEFFSPYLCITIDDYPTVHVEHRANRDGMKYTFVQIPSRQMSDLQPITEKLVAMLDRKPKEVMIDDTPTPYFLYIANFIKFKVPTAGNMVSGKLVTNGEVESEGTRIADYLGDYASHFYHWMGYSLSVGEDLFPLNLPDWLYKHECIHDKHQLHRLVSMNPYYNVHMQQGTLVEAVKAKGKDPALFEYCFLNIGPTGDPNLYATRGGRKTKRRKRRRSNIFYPLSSWTAKKSARPQRENSLNNDYVKGMRSVTSIKPRKSKWRVNYKRMMMHNPR